MFAPQELISKQWESEQAGWQVLLEEPHALTRGRVWFNLPGPVPVNPD